MKTATIAILGAAAVVGVYLIAQQSQDAAILEDQPNAVDDMVSTTQRFLGLWAAPAQYADMIAQAEADNGIPARMLERLLWQECRYRQDIITGARRSSAGALGIAQFMPATAREMGIDPLNPAQAIPAAGRYLARMYRATGSWSEALAAYNWGIGNVTRRGLESAPNETINYYTQILADVNGATGGAYA